MHWVPPTGTCSHMCMWDLCVYVYLPYCTPSVFTHLSKCHSLLDTCTHLCCWHCPSHQLHSFSSACRWYGCHSTLSSNPPRRTADKGMSTASVAAAVHQYIHTTALPFGSSNAESCAEPHRTREASQGTYCHAFAHPSDALSVTAELWHCFHG